MRLRFAIFAAALAALFQACTSDASERMADGSPVRPLEPLFRTDTVSFGLLPQTDARRIFSLDEPSSVVTDPQQRRFNVDSLIQLQQLGGDSLRITSYSAATIRDVTLVLHLPDADTDIAAAYFDSLPGFGQFEFRPSWLGQRLLLRTGAGAGDVIEFECDSLDLQAMSPRFVSDDEHLARLRRIECHWDVTFSNFGWTPENDATHNWEEMRPIYAREWVVILTNYAYMLSTPEMRHLMANFETVFGGSLHDNAGVAFTAERYLEELERMKSARHFDCGLTASNVGGLGGGNTFGLAHYNFYGHYASFSGWEAIGHEHMHCMGFSHDSNMTYASDNIGWTILLWQLHSFLRDKGRLPYLDRNLLGFHKDENAPYRLEGIRADFMDDDQLNALIKYYHDNSALVRYLEEHPLE